MPEFTECLSRKYCEKPVALTIASDDPTLKLLCSPGLTLLLSMFYSLSKLMNLVHYGIFKDLHTSAQATVTHFLVFIVSLLSLPPSVPPSLLASFILLNAFSLGFQITLASSNELRMSPPLSVSGSILHSRRMACFLLLMEFTSEHSAGLVSLRCQRSFRIASVCFPNTFYFRIIILHRRFTNITHSHTALTQLTLILT